MIARPRFSQALYVDYKSENLVKNKVLKKVAAFILGFKGEGSE